MKVFNFMLSLLVIAITTTHAQCDVEILGFNWNTYEATVAIDCDEGVSDITLYLGNSNLDDIPPCGNFSQNINWPEYTFTFFSNINVTQDTVTLNIFDAWNNVIANPYTIAECWVQLYESGFTCEGGEVGIWQVNIGEALGDSYVTFDGACPCDTITEIIYQTDTIVQYVDVIVHEYVYITDTIYETDTITEYHTLTQYIDCETGLPCTQNGCDETTIYAPNAVTPNGDGWNDTWQVIADNCWDEWEVRIYNRWGGLVWISVNSLDEWDATVATGVYIYTIKAIKHNPTEVYEMNGYVTVFY